MSVAAARYPRPTRRRLPLILSGTCLAVALSLVIPAPALVAQQWRGRASTRIQYVEARPLSLDSVLVGQTTGTGQLRTYSDTLVTCAPGQSHCFFYRPASVVSTSPITQDLELSAWGLGVEGLRLYLNTRVRAALGDAAFWPRSDDHFDLITGYVELNRPAYRVRVGRDHQLGGLGYYAYDGGSVELRWRPARAEFEAYGGWGLERGLADRATSEVLRSLDQFQPRKNNYLFGFRGSARPIAGSAVEAIYQREVQTDQSGVTSERVGLDVTLAPTGGLSLRGHADYDLATGRWGKANATVGWTPVSELYLEGRIIRYRPVFSLQTIWVVFDPTPYTGWGASLGVRPATGVTLRLDGERRQYEDTGAEVPFQLTTDRTWRAGAFASWQTDRFDVQGGYWLNFSFGSALSAGDVALHVSPARRLRTGVRVSAFQQLEEFRVTQGRVWSVGGDLQWESPWGTFWGSVDRYRHDRRGDGASRLDWNQIRASFGMAVYLGSEPGRP